MSSSSLFFIYSGNSFIGGIVALLGLQAVEWMDARNDFCWFVRCVRRVSVVVYY